MNHLFQIKTNKNLESCKSGEVSKLKTSKLRNQKLSRFSISTYFATFVDVHFLDLFIPLLYTFSPVSIFSEYFPFFLESFLILSSLHLVSSEAVWMSVALMYRKY